MNLNNKSFGFGDKHFPGITAHFDPKTKEVVAFEIPNFVVGYSGSSFFSPTPQLLEACQRMANLNADYAKRNWEIGAGAHIEILADALGARAVGGQKFGQGSTSDALNTSKISGVHNAGAAILKKLDDQGLRINPFGVVALSIQKSRLPESVSDVFMQNAERAERNAALTAPARSASSEPKPVLLPPALLC
jgi:hypothetical protein